MFTQASAESVDGVPNGVGDRSTYWLVPLKLRAKLLVSPVISARGGRGPLV